MIAVKNNEVYIAVGSVEDLAPTITALSRALCWEAGRRQYHFTADEVDSSFIITGLIAKLSDKMNMVYNRKIV